MTDTLDSRENQIPEKMDSRKLAALLSSLVSELLVVLFLVFPSSTPLSLTSNSNSSSNSRSFSELSSLIHHFLSSQEFVATLSLLSVSRKRKRAQLLEFELEPSSDDEMDGDVGARVTQGRVKLGLGQNPDFFRNSFKMKASTFEWLSGLLEPLLECRDPAGCPLNLSAELRLGVGLFRLSSGSDYPEIAQRFGVPESVARFCAKQLCRVLCTNFRFWVGFPSPGELESVSDGFEALTGLPNCCGVVDCTRFRIDRNGGSEMNEEEGEDSIAAQIVVDSESRILSIAAGFRGQKGDWKVLKSSCLYKDIEGERLLCSSPINVNEVDVNQYLVGNGDYPLLHWLMVPFVDTVPGSREENFNAALGLMRSSALKTIASLKNWGVLSQSIQEEFKTAVSYIAACSILHNVLLMREDHSALSDCFEDKTLENQASLHLRDISLDENSTETKGCIARSALATRAKVLCQSKHCEDPSGSEHM